MVARVLLTLLLAAVFGAAGAVAATTSSSLHHGVKSNPYENITYKAGDGEANRLGVSHSDTEGWVFEDSGAVIVAGEGCSSSGQRARCGHRTAVRGRSVGIDLRDGDDEVTVQAVGHQFAGDVFASGGVGRDVLRAVGPVGPPSTALSGGEGDDVLSTTRGGGLNGGPGADQLTGSDAGDRLVPGIDSDADVVDGRGGRDLLIYEEARAGVRVDLGRAQGLPGDTLRSIESAAGGSGRDVLLGSAGDNTLFGHSGDDTLRGGAGDDRLDGDDGRDLLFGGLGDDDLTDWRDGELDGGPGDDVLDPWPGNFRTPRPRIVCGPGTDAVVVPEPDSNRVSATYRFIPDDCELTEVGGGRFGPFTARPRVARGVANWSLFCRQATFDRRCIATLELRGGGHRLGRGSVSIPKRRRATLRVPLNSAGRRFVARGGRLSLALTVATIDGDYTRHWSVRIKPQR